MAPQMYQVEPGATHPLGAVPDEQGVNFSLFSEHATSVKLLLLAEHNDPDPLQTIHHFEPGGPCIQCMGRNGESLWWRDGLGFPFPVCSCCVRIGM